MDVRPAAMTDHRPKHKTRTRSLKSSFTQTDNGGCLQGRVLQVASTLAANLISLCFGYGSAFPSAVLPELEKYYSEEQISWIMAGPMMGGPVGAATWGQITPRIGPKYSALVTGVPMLIAWCLQLNIGNYWCLMAGRVLKGFASGGLLSTVPHYVNEIAEDSLRGTLGSVINLATNIGALLAYVLGGFLNGFYMALVCAVIPVIFMVFFFPCPQSPIYLIHRDRAEKGERILERLRYPRDISDELGLIHSASETENVSWVDLFENRASRKALGLSLTMFVIQQLTGILPVLSYVTDIFRRAGGSVDPVTGSCIVATVQIFGSLIGMFLIERCGRRILMMSSCLGITLIHGLMGYALMPGSGTPEWLPVTCLSIFLFAYTAGADITPFVIMTELPSASVRSKVASATTLFTGIVIFTTVKTFSYSVNLIGIHGLFWMYAIGTAFGALFTFFFLPETAGRSNASIQEELNGNRGKQLAEKLPK